LKVVEATHVFCIQKSVGFSFTMADGATLNKLVDLKDIDVKRNEEREIIVGDQ